MGSHSKTRRAVQRLRRFARRLREADREKERRSGSDRQSVPIDTPKPSPAEAGRRMPRPPRSGVTPAS
jgi:hypothetical protein